MKLVGPTGETLAEFETDDDREPELGLFIDPASRETGWCVAMPAEDYGVMVLAAGVIGFDLRHDKNPYLRVNDIRHGLEHIMNKLDKSLSVFAIEVTSGKVNRGRHKGGGAGLAIHGVSVGALWTCGLMWKPPSGGDGPMVVPVTENAWKGGFGKEKSARVAKLYFDAYVPEDDVDYNRADAIAFAVWYYTYWLRKRDHARRDQMQKMEGADGKATGG